MPETPSGERRPFPELTLLEALDGAQRVFVTAHVDPDPDGLGCVLGLSHLLKREGWAAAPVCIGHLPSFAGDLPGVDDIVVVPSRLGEQEPRRLLQAADALVVVDTPAAARLAAFYETHRDVLATATIINIDHHYTNEGFGAYNFVDPQAAATAEVVCDLLDASGIEIDEPAAVCLMTALVADTQCFRTESTTPRSLELARRLWEAGAPLFPIARAIFANRPLSGLRLWGAALDRVKAKAGVVFTAVTEDMLEKAGATMEDTEGLVDFLLTTQNARAAIVFKQQMGETKVSIRTVPGVDATKIAGVFNGGGHQRAAGCTILSNAREAARQLIPIAVREATAGDRRG